MVSRRWKCSVCVAVVLVTVTAWTQVSSSPQVTSSSPVAYVYVASAASSSTNHIVAYTAGANGSLTAIPGSPFPENVYAMAVNGKYLMGASRATTDINAYHITSNGSLTFAAASSYSQYNTNGCGGAGQVFFDHTGATLYVQEFDFDCANTGVASFGVVKATGALSFLGVANTGAFPGDYTAAYFIGNNVYAYSADQSACMYPAVYGFHRASSGLLNLINNFQYNQPTPPAGVSIYYPDLAVADPTNHVAVLEQPANPPGCAPGALQLAVYTADASGNLKTNSTYKTMPATKIKSPFDMKMSPSGKLLAVAGQEGLQVFHFNGANPITGYTSLLTTSPINQMFWDNNNHLYAISQSAGKLFVFTITPTSHGMAPGSPHTISRPQDIIVQPLALF